MLCVLVAQPCRLFATPWTVTCQGPLSMEFSRQEYWSGLPFLSLGDLPDPGIEPRSSALQAGSLLSEPPGKPFKFYFYTVLKVDFHLQLLQNIGYIPHVVQHVLKPALHLVVCISQSPIPMSPLLPSPLVTTRLFTYICESAAFPKQNFKCK